MAKDWTGNYHSIYITLGASNHSQEERAELDYYATEPLATKLLLEKETFNDILEPACGEGHISKVLLEAGYKVTSYDLIDRGFGEVLDFFSLQKWGGVI